MLPTFDEILANKDKESLDKYAAARGIKLDGRRSFENMLADFRAREATATEPEPEPAMKFIEVEILRKYAPRGFVNESGQWLPQPAEIKETVKRGETIRLPRDEAERAITHGIAMITARSFG